MGFYSVCRIACESLEIILKDGYFSIFESLLGDYFPSSFNITVFGISLVRGSKVFIGAEGSVSYLGIENNLCYIGFGGHYSFNLCNIFALFVLEYPIVY